MSVEFIKQHFSYNPETGKVFFLSSGKECGWIDDGYVRVCKFNRFFYAHKIAFAIMIGVIPDIVDHKDLNRSNNKWSNLRAADYSGNASNCNIRSSNKLKVKGVSWSKSNNCYRMDIQFKKIKYYSYHLTIEEAAEAYRVKSAELHGEFGRA